MADSLGKGNTRRLEGIFSQEASYNDIRKTSCERGKSEGGSWIYCLFSRWSDSGRSPYVLLQIKR